MPQHELCCHIVSQSRKFKKLNAHAKRLWEHVHTHTNTCDFLSIHVPYTCKPQKSYSDSLADPEFIISDFAKFDRPAQLHLAFQALDKFQGSVGHLPRSYNKEDAMKLLELAKEMNGSGPFKVCVCVCVCACCVKNVHM